MCRNPCDLLAILRIYINVHFVYHTPNNISHFMEKGTPDKSVSVGGSHWGSLWFFTHCCALIYSLVSQLHYLHISTISRRGPILQAEPLYHKVCDRIHQPLPREQVLRSTSVVYSCSMAREKSQEHSGCVPHVGHHTLGARALSTSVAFAVPDRWSNTRRYSW